MIASINMNNSVDGELLIKQIKDTFIEHFGEYASWKMNDFLNDILTPMIEKSYQRYEPFGRTTCKNEEDACVPSLMKAYKALYLPFYVMKIPLMKLGFGQFVSYFSRLVARSSKGEFLSGYRINPYENILKKYLVDIFDNIAYGGTESSNISIFEVSKALHERYYHRKTFDDKPTSLMKKYGCRGNEQERLEKDWKYWIHCQNTCQSYPLKKRPCQNRTEDSNRDYYQCCETTRSLHDKLRPLLKVMKYAAQPPHYIETDEEMNLTFNNANFLNYPLSYPLPKIFRNPKIPICAYDGIPENPRLTNCRLFSRSISNEGLGYTFNGANFWDLYNETLYTRIFADIMFPKGSKSARTPRFNERLLQENARIGVKYPGTAGSLHGLNIVLSVPNLYTDIHENITFKTLDTPFKVNKIS